MEKEAGKATLRHGVSLLPDCRPDRRSAPDYYRDVLALCRLADSAGIDYVKMTEHYLGDYGGYCPSPLTFMATVAAQTERIRLMTGAVLPAFHHPIQIAAHASMVDAISNGRLDVGFGRAWLPYEFEAFGVPLDESRDRYQTTIMAVLRLWAGDKVSEDTPFFAYENATSLPPVTQKPHPPVWGAAVRSPESFKWLGENGMGLLLSLPPVKDGAGLSRNFSDLYLKSFQASEALGRPRIALSIPLYVARTDAEAYAIAEPYYLEHLRVISEAASSWATARSSAYPGYHTIGGPANQPFDLRHHGTAVIGSPESVIDQIHQLREEYRADTFLWQVDFGGQGLAQMKPSLDLLVEEVLPGLE